MQAAGYNAVIFLGVGVETYQFDSDTDTDPDCVSYMLYEGNRPVRMVDPKVIPLTNRKKTDAPRGSNSRRGQLVILGFV